MFYSRIPSTYPSPSPPSFSHGGRTHIISQAYLTPGPLRLPRSSIQDARDVATLDRPAHPASVLRPSQADPLLLSLVHTAIIAPADPSPAIAILPDRQLRCGVQDHGRLWAALSLRHSARGSSEANRANPARIQRLFPNVPVSLLLAANEASALQMDTPTEFRGTPQVLCTTNRTARNLR